MIWSPVTVVAACALPMLWATANKVKVDTFVVYTDNETWAGSIHPHQALRGYRDWSGIDARLVVVGLTATDFTIADPADPGMLDIAGFDSALPTLLTDFSARVI
jgi:60 kDa SS-A/Ro ribonucleoprotein